MAFQWDPLLCTPELLSTLCSPTVSGHNNTEELQGLPVLNTYVD